MKSPIDLSNLSSAQRRKRADTAVLTACQADYNTVPATVVADGCYASHANVDADKEMKVKRTVFNKPAGLRLLDMGVKKKTFRLWRDFRAGIEGNISELKRAFGAGKVK